MKTQLPNVKIAIVSAYAEEISKAAAQEANVAEVIPKSEFNVEKLRQLLVSLRKSNSPPMRK